MKVLFAAMPFAGHLNPLTGVATRLRDRGHEVRWYVAPSLVPRVERLGIRALPYVRADEVTDENIAELHPERARCRGPKLIAFDFEHIFARCVDGHVADVRAIHEQWAFDALVCDGAFFAASILGPVLEVDVFTVEPGPLPVASGGVPPPFFGLRPARHAGDRLVHRVVMRMVHSTMRSGLVELNRVRATYDLAPITVEDVLACNLRVARRAFQVGAPELDYPRGAPPANMEYVGALLPAPGPVPEALVERMRTASGPVVVVSQGTIDNRRMDKLVEPTIAALATEDVTVVALTGGIGTDELRRRHAGPACIIEDFAAYASIFPNADLFVSNGGHGSVLAALAHGVPLVVAGTREGKNDINARLAWNGVAYDLRTERPRPRAIRAAVRAALGDRELRARVERVASILAGYDSLAIVERGVTGGDHASSRSPSGS